MASSRAVLSESMASPLATKRSWVRALTLQNSSFVLGGQGTETLTLPFLSDEWTFVAVAFDQSASAAKLFVNGRSATINATAAGLGMGDLVVGGASTLMGFMGYLSGLFAYGDFLDDDALNFLYNFRAPSPLLPVAGNAGYVVTFGEGFSVVVQDPGYLGGLSAFTLGFWHRIKDPLPPGEAYLVNKSIDAGFEYALSVADIEFIGLRYYTVYLGDSRGTPTKTLVSKAVTAVSDWTQVTVQWDGANVYVFLNGTLLGNSSWESARLPEFLAPLTIGSPQSTLISFDSFMLWNVSLPLSETTTLLSLPDPHDPRLILYFDFNEGSGTACFGSNLVGYFEPLFVSSSKNLASLLWSYSEAPILSQLEVIEDGFAMIKLNASSVGGGLASFEIVQLPVHGVLLVSQLTNSGASDVQPPFLAQQRRLHLSDTITTQPLFYSPNQGYVGNDSFAYVARSGGIASINVQRVDVSVGSAPKAPSLRLGNSTLLVEQLSIWDQDAWETNTPINVRLELDNAEGGQHPTFSLASTVGIDFNENNAFGVGERVTETSFVSDPPHANDAAGALQFQFPDSFENMALLRVAVTDFIQSQPTEASASASVTLSSIPRISAVTPSVVTVSSEANVTVSGSFFDSDVSLCKVGNTTAQALLLTPYSIRCKLSILAPDTYSFRVLTRAGIASNSLLLTVVPPLNILTASPSTISSSGGAVIAITLSESVNICSVFCLFDGTAYKGEVVSPVSINCRSPKTLRANMTAVALAVNSVEVSSNFVTIAVSPAPTLYWVEYPTVFATNMYLQALKLFGTGLSFNGTVSCFLAGYNTLYTMISDMEARCVVPMNEALRGSFPLSMVLNGQEVIATGISIRFIGPPHIIALLPSTAPKAGNVTVDVIGRSFDSTSGIMCAFGSILVPAMYMNETLLRCFAPQVDAQQQVFVSLVTLDGPLTAESISFLFFETPTVFKVTPTSVPMTGGFDIFISGANFLGMGMQSCFWNCSGALITSFAAVNSEMAMICKSPDITIPGTCMLYLSISDRYEYPVLNVTLFDRPSLKSITPSSGSIEGGSLISLAGDFLLGVETVCSFGGLIVPAVAINSSTIECKAPPAPPSFNLTIDLTLIYWPYQNYPSQSFAFTYYRPVEITAFTPSGGSLTFPTVLTLYGSGFRDYGTSFCSINGSVIDAVIVSSTEATCTLPSMQNRTGILNISLTLNGVNFSPPVKFWVWSSAVISNVTPRIVVSNSANVFSISGLNFWTIGIAYCTLDGTVIVPIVRTPTYMSCTGQVAGPGNLVMGVTRDEGLTIESSFNVEVIDAIVIQSVFPPFIFESDLTKITLILQGPLPGTTSPVCRFDAGSKIMRFPLLTNGNSADCIVFGLSAGLHNIGIEAEDVLLTANNSFYGFQVSSALSSPDIQPSRVVLGREQTVNVSWASGPSLSGNISVVVKVANMTSVCEVRSVTSVRCSIIPVESGLVAVQMSFWGQTYINVGYILVAPGSRTVLVPTSGPVKGGTRVVVVGGNFDPLSTYQCLFGTSLVMAEYISSLEVQCTTPLASLASTVNITFLIDSVDIVSTPFEYYDQPIIDSNGMNHSRFTGGEPLSIRYNFTGSPLRYCFINGRSIVSANASTNEIACRTPFELGLASIDISPNGVDPSGQPIVITVVATPIVEAIFPTAGFMRGGTNVSLSGRFLSDIAFCQFGPLKTPAFSLSDTEAVCSTPPSSVSNIVPMKVSVNGLNFLPTNIGFTYITQIILETVTPSMGPETGGTVVLIKGLGSYLGPVWCVFDGVVVTGSLLGGGAVSCVTVASQPGDVELRVMTLGGEIADNSLIFSYYPLPTVVKSIPSVCQTGRICRVLMIGANFIDSPAVSVMIGRLIVPATYINATAIQFYAPGSLGGKQPVKISNNGVDFTFSSVSVTYVPPLSVQPTELPNLGPLTGGTPLRFHLNNASAPRVSCLILGLTVPAILLHSLYECRTLPSLTASSTIIVIRNDDMPLYSFTYFYYNDPFITALYPRSHGEMGGPVDIIGEGFLPSNNLTCMFGDESSPAVFISSRKIICQAPIPRSLGNVTVQISFNGLDFITADSTFLYTSNATISEVVPRTIASTGAIITVYGTSFIPGVCCILGADFAVALKVYNSTTISCLVPATSNNSVLVDVSNNCFDRSGYPRLVRVVDPPRVLGLSVNYGPLGGGTVVRASLSIIEDLNYTVAVGDQTAVAVAVDKYIEWVTPEQTTPGNYPVYISMEDIPLTPTNFAFYYFSEPSLFSVEPAIGSETGDTLVYIFGENLGPTFSTYCVFGSLAYAQRATFVSSSVIFCPSPPQSPGVVQLRISFDLQQLSSEFLEFQYANAVVVNNIAPAVVYCGFGGEVMVTGANFVNTTQLSCHLSGIYYPATFVTSELLRCYLFINYSSDILLAVSINGVDTSRTSVPLRVLDPFTIAAISPPAVLNVQEAALEVQGTGFQLEFSYLCMFDDGPRTLANVISETSILCYLPVFHIEGGLAVQVEITIAANTLSVRYTEKVTVVSLPPVSKVSPTIGPDVGGWMLNIEFDGTLPTWPGFTLGFVGGQLCDAFAIGTFLSCLMPSLPIGDSIVQLSVNGETYYDIGDITIVGGSQVISSFPSFSYVEGNQTIRVVGSDFSLEFPLCCEFDGILQSAAVVNATMVTCVTPPHDPGVLEVRVLLCGAYSPTSELWTPPGSFLFRYLAREVINGYFPSSGLLSGANLTFSGSGFDYSKEYICNYESMNSEHQTNNAYILSPTALQCLLPVVQHGVYHYNLSLYVFSSMSIDYLLYSSNQLVVSDPFLLQMVPNNGSELGDTEVTISGKYLSGFVAPACKFGDVQVSGIPYFETSAIEVIWNIVCLSPSYPPGNVSIEVSANGIDFYPTDFIFEFNPAPKIAGSHPVVLTDSTKNVTFVGNYLMSGNELSCVFGSEFAQLLEMDDNTLICEVPETWRLLKSNFNATIGIDLNANPLYRVNAVKIPTPEVYGFAPSSGPASGGTTVIITGDRFTNAPTAVCTFGGTEVTAFYIDPTTISCTSPATDISNIGYQSSMFGLIFNDGDIYLSIGYFNYYEDLRILSAFPPFSFENQLDLVFIRGPFYFSGPTNSLCRTQLDSYPLVIIGTSLAYCIMESLPVGTYSVEVSLNGQNFESIQNYSLDVVPNLQWEGYSPQYNFLVDSFTLINVNLTDPPKIFTASNLSLVCSLNGTFFPAIVESSFVACRVSPNATGVYDLDILIAATGQSVLATLPSVDFVSPPNASVISPPTLYVGIPSLVFISGIGLSGFDCAFALASAAQNVIRIIPSLSSDSEIVCEAPSYFRDAVDGEDRILAGVVFADSLPWFLSSMAYLVPFTVQGFSPQVIFERLPQNITVIGDNFSALSDARCRIGGQSFGAIVLGQTLLLCLDVSIPTIGSYSLDVADHTLSRSTVDAYLIVVSSPTSVFVPGGQLFCAENNPTSELLILGSGFSASRDFIRCRIDSIISLPASVNDTTIICPCIPSLEKPAENDFSLLLEGNSFSFFSLQLTYISIPSVMTPMTAVPVGYTLPYAIPIPMWNASNILCRLFSPSNLAISSSAVRITDAGMTCDLTCGTGDLGGAIVLQIAVNNVLITNITSFICVEAPRIVSYHPEGVIEDLVSTIDVLVQSPVVTATNLSCIFNGIYETATSSVIKYYSNEAVYLGLSCTAPPLPVGMAGLEIGFDSFRTAVVPISVFPFPEVLQVIPNRIPAYRNTELFVTLSNNLSLPSQSIFSYSLDSIDGNRIVCSVKKPPITCLLSSLNPADYSLYFFINSTFLSSTILTVHPPVGILDVYPFGAVIGTTSFVKVQINSSSLSEIGVATCNWGDFGSPGVKVNGSTLLCQTPAVEQSIVLMLAVSIDGFISSSVPFYFFSPVSDISITPTFGTSVGGTNVTISSPNLPAMIPYDCYFGSIKVAAVYAGASRFTCSSPSSIPGKVDFAIIVRGISARINSQNVEYTYVDELVVIDAFPLSLTAGTLLTVTIYGMNLMDIVLSLDAQCLLGSHRSAAIVTSSNTLDCITPDLMDGTALTLGITLNGVDVYNAPSLSLKYITAPILTNLVPWHGPSAGGTLISVVGVGFSDNLPVMCKVDGNSSQPVSVNQTAVVCHSTASIPGHLSEISLLFGEFEAGPPLYFLSDADFVIHGIEPTMLAISQNSTFYIQIIGESFAEYVDQRCMVGAAATSLIWASSSTLLCELPVLISPGSVSVFVSYNGFDYVFAGSIAIIDELLLYSLSPASGPQTGFSSVIIQTSGHDVTLNYVCRFGALSMTATVLDFSHLSCQSPPMLYFSGPVDVIVAASNGSLISSSLSYYYYSTPSITSISPRQGSQAGGTLVSLTLSSVPNIPVFFQCMFGDVPAPSSFFLSANLAQCVSPAHIQGAVQISITLNGKDFEGSGAAFLFLPPIVFYDVTPSFVYVNTPSMLSLFGEFQPYFNWSCMFGASRFEASWKTPTLVTCTVMADYISSQAVALSPNGVDWSVGPYVDVIPSIELLSVYPSIIFYQGGITIFVNGYLFNASHPYSIELKSAQNGISKTTLCTYLNSTTLSFVVPPWTPTLGESSDLLRVLLHSGLKTFENPAVNIQIHGMIRLLSISPSLLLYPGTFLSLDVANITFYCIATIEFSLNFSDAGSQSSARASLVAGERLSVAIPPLHSLTPYTAFLTQVLVRLKFDSGYTSNALPFSYMISRILASNSSITEDGGQVVLQVDFWPQGQPTLCQLGDAIVSSLYSLESKLITCEFGSLAAGTYTVSISPNDGVEWIESPYAVVVTTDLHIVSAYPLLGPTTGFTNVSLTISPEISSDAVPLCRFGSIEIPALITSRSSIACLSPAAPSSAQVTLGVVFRTPLGHLDSNISSTLLYLYHEPIILFSLNPNQGSMMGGTHITISGSGFIASPLLLVKFSSADYDILVNATWLTAATLSVLSPANEAGTEDSFLDVRVSNNGVDFSSQSLSFFWDASVIYFGVYPSVILETGGDVISVDGEGFSQSYPNTFRCRFGGIYTVEAFMTTNEQLRCIAPPMSPGLHKLDVSVNGIDFENAGTLNYVPVPDLLSLYPSSGTCRGGTNVTITFQGFTIPSSVYCVFDGVAVSATVTSTATIACRTPPGIMNAEHTVDVSVLLSFGSMVTLNSNLNFTYIDDPIVSSVSVLSGPSTGNYHKYCSV